jgi:CRP/FNR family transcriptional regulator, cyclic AMP receptor protein
MYNSRSIETILKEHAFFEGLDSRLVTLLAGCASNVVFEPGDYLFRQGEEANQFYLLRQGRVALEIYEPHCTPVTVETLEKDDVLGSVCPAAPRYWPYDGRALQLTRAIALDGKCLRSKCEQNHDLAYSLIERLVRILEQRLQSARTQLMDVYAAHR